MCEKWTLCQLVKLPWIWYWHVKQFWRTLYKAFRKFMQATVKWLTTWIVCLEPLLRKKWLEVAGSALYISLYPDLWYKVNAYTFSGCFSTFHLTASPKIIWNSVRCGQSNAMGSKELVHLISSWIYNWLPLNIIDFILSIIQ